MQNDGLVIHNLDRLQRPQHRGGLLRVVIGIQRVVDIRPHGFRVEGGAVVEDDISSKMEGVGEAVRRDLPAFSQAGNELARIRVEEHQRVIHRCERNPEL
jgi:hypothetical protein